MLRARGGLRRGDARHGDASVRTCALLTISVMDSTMLRPPRSTGTMPICRTAGANDDEHDGRALTEGWPRARVRVLGSERGGDAFVGFARDRARTRSAMRRPFSSVTRVFTSHASSRMSAVAS